MKNNYTETEFRKVVSRGLSQIKYEEEGWNKIKRQDYRKNKKKGDSNKKKEDTNSHSE